MDGSSSPDTHAAPAQPGWVPWSTPDSIARGRISLLALAEIPAAMALFWWISSLSPWPWLTLLGLMAAPILLLRSEESIEAGLGLFRRYWEKRELSRRETIALFLVTTIITIGLASGLAQSLLPGHTGWALFGRGALVEFAAFVVAFAAAVTVAGTVAVRIAGAVMVAVVSAVAVAGVVAGPVASAGAGTVVGAVMVAVVSASAVASAGAGTVAGTVAGAGAGVILLPSMLLGVFVRAVSCRLWASLRHLRTGLAAFPANWRETVGVIDLRHRPDLLPRGGEIDPSLTLNGLLAVLPSISRGDDKVLRYAAVLIFAPLIYLPALLYRWNIKASAVIWGPVAYVLRPAVWLDDEDMRCELSRLTLWSLQTVLWTVTGLLILWLFSAFLPDLLKAELPHWLQTVTTQWPPPQPGLRFGMLGLWGVSMAGLLLAAAWTRAPHGKALESAKDFDSYSEKHKARVKALATVVRHCLQWVLAVSAVTVWVFALWWAQQRWPEVVWDWLRPYL